MAYTAKLAKTKGSPGVIWAAALCILLGFSSLASGSGYPLPDKAISQLKQALASTDETTQATCLNSALSWMKKARVSEDRKAASIAAIRSAIDDLNNHESDKVTQDINQAIADIQVIITPVEKKQSIVETPAPPPAPTIPEHAAPTVKLTEDQARAVVLVKGDNAEGTGFLVKTADGPVVYTNIHVISDNPNLKITTNTGTPITILSYKGATDRDLAMISIKDGDFKYLDLATDVSGTVQTGDEVVTPGNSEGGEVMLNTGGKILGIGPDRIEFDNPIYHGNSGGPVFHVKSCKVIGIVTEAMKVDTTDALDKASFANRNSAISHSMRYFGFRIDNVPGWEAYDWRRFQNETAFLDQFDLRSQYLDSFLNAPNDNKPEDNTWQKDDQIVKANSGFFEQANGADTSQQVDADRVMWGEISDLARTDMDAIQNPNNFYAFDQQRAGDEAAYRKALQTELEKINANVSQLGSLPRSNH